MNNYKKSANRGFRSVEERDPAGINWYKVNKEYKRRLAISKANKQQKDILNFSINKPLTKLNFE